LASTGCSGRRITCMALRGSKVERCVSASSRVACWAWAGWRAS
jgi:hypothetical protein